jgi:hypothetical protein
MALRQIRLHPTAMHVAVLPADDTPSGTRAVGVLGTGIDARVHRRRLDVANIDGAATSVVDSAALHEPLARPRRVVAALRDGDCVVVNVGDVGGAVGGAASCVEGPVSGGALDVGGRRRGRG